MSHEGIRFLSKEEQARKDLADRPLSRAALTPAKVRVKITEGTGLEIDWQDGHKSSWGFAWLRDACPCALCDDERGKSGRKPGERPKLAPGALPMFKEAARPLTADAVGKYAIKFHWNDGHELGIYSWQFLRDVCPCDECKTARAMGKVG